MKAHLDCRWVAAKEAGLEGQAVGLTLADKEDDDVEKRLPGGKVKKKAKPEVILEVATRSKKKSVTTILGGHACGYLSTGATTPPLLPVSLTPLTRSTASRA